MPAGKYPFSRATPSSSSRAGNSDNGVNNTPHDQVADRPIVVSASGRNPNASPALNGGSPSTLRSRLASPRNILAGVFRNDTANYPSPMSASGTPGGNGSANNTPAGGDSTGKVKKGMKRSKGGWLQLNGDSPSKDTPTKSKPGRSGWGLTGSSGGNGASSSNNSENNTRGSYELASRGAAAQNISIPRYDPRGYPARNRPPNEAAGGTNGAAAPLLKHSRSQESMPTMNGPAAAAAGGADGSRFLSADNRPVSYYAQSGPSSLPALSAPSSSSSTNTYPPIMDYSLGAPSYNPYAPPSSDGHGAQDYNNYYGSYGGLGYSSAKDPLPSLYGGSAPSVRSMRSGNSMTEFARYDQLQDSYSGFSISSKGGKRNIADMFNLPADPLLWSDPGPEPDDDFHDPDIRPNRKTRFASAICTPRGAANMGCLMFLLLTTMMLFGGYPVLSSYLAKKPSTHGAFNIGGINATGQIPSLSLFNMIDKDTPQSAYTSVSLDTGATWELVFSDEFNRDGRTFWEGDDPYWQAANLHYWQTNNLEWYDPRAVTTKNGKLVVTLTDMPNNGMNYTGGMISTWNRFCFTGGYVEAAVSLPGANNVEGLWPAIWSMGNLGRAGYGGSLDGMWPYTYDSCDVGTLANQTNHGVPDTSTFEGDIYHGNSFSYLPGQRLSRCTCPSDTTHPGPKLPNGTYVGRGAPEIDMFEALINADSLFGQVSQSAQWAPFNPGYTVVNNSNTYSVSDPANTYINPYAGGIYQQATSALATTNQSCYTDETGCFAKYGFEYKPGYGQDSYISWVNNGKKSWTIRAPALAANAQAQIGARPIPEEPMYLIINLGLSENFGVIDFKGLAKLWPVTLEVDYIRVYQDPNNRNVGCDPPNFPTANYIARFPDIYSNANITTMEQIPNFTKPKNRLIDTC